MRKSRDKFTYAFIDEPPFGFPGKNGEVLGYDAEIAKIIASRLGFQAFESRMVTFDELITGVQSNEWTMNTAMFVTEKRSTLVSFSRPIWRLTDGILVKRGNPYGVRSYSDLVSRGEIEVGAVRGNVQLQRALTAGFPTERLKVFESQSQIVSELIGGSIDAYPGAALAHRGFIERGGLNGLEVVEIESGTGEVNANWGAFSFSKEATQLLHEFNQQLSVFVGSDEHKEIARRYGLMPDESLTS